MKSSTSGLLALFVACVRLASASPVAASNEVCGPQNGGQICPGTQCCSQYGYCGTTSAYCAKDSCQAGYGKCSGGTKTPVSTDARCGAQSGFTCAGSAFGNC